MAVYGVVPSADIVPVLLAGAYAGTIEGTGTTSLANLDGNVRTAGV